MAIAEKNYPIIVIGYGNPSYVYFKKLNFTDPGSIPNLDYQKLEAEKGFSFAYIGLDNKIYGYGYQEDINIDKILEVINNALKEDESVRQMIYNEKEKPHV